MSRDLWAITCHYNPAGYVRRVDNYQVFREQLRARDVPLVTVECMFGDAAPCLPPSADVVHVRARDVLWQKERLLNLALARLPRWVEKVAWLDADVLFDDPTWATKTSRLLDTVAVVQPFEGAVRLPPGACVDDGTSTERFTSFCREVTRDPALLTQGRYDPHGHTGFAWAARRELLDAHGLYDACVAGSADHVMAHAFAGGLHSACVERIFAPNEVHKAHFMKWAERVWKSTQGKVGFVPGALLHLFHGELKHRAYLERNRELATLRYDPDVDLVRVAEAPLAFSGVRPDLRAWASTYFARRLEDEGATSD